MLKITEPAKDIQVVEEVDICIIGGSCTGVFAAVRAARLGAKVAIIEKMNAFGGVATLGLVNIWHSLKDTEFNKPIIAGLTMEITERLKKRDAVFQEDNNPHAHAILNTEELKIELDELVMETGKIVPFFHTFYAAPHVKDGNLEAVFIENKDGRRAIKAKVFIDASGDGDLLFHLELPFILDEHLQAPTTCAKIKGLCPEGVDMQAIIKAHHEEFGLERDRGWSGIIPGVDDIKMHAETHVFRTNAADATDLTKAEIEGRRHIRAIMDMFRKHAGAKDMVLLDLASYIGIRETRRFHGEYQLTEDDVLWGKSFDDTIANGSYHVDVHQPVDGGFIFKFLDGTMKDINFNGVEEGRWREEVDKNPTFYQVPYRTMIHKKFENVICAGRMISTDKGAFGAVRVMVNLNQIGEAAGVAAYLALASDQHVCDIDIKKLQQTLRDGGSIIF